MVEQHTSPRGEALPLDKSVIASTIASRRARDGPCGYSQRKLVASLMSPAPL